MCKLVSTEFSKCNNKYEELPKILQWSEEEVGYCGIKAHFLASACVFTCDCTLI